MINTQEEMKILLAFTCCLNLVLSIDAREFKKKTRLKIAS